MKTTIRTTGLAAALLLAGLTAPAWAQEAPAVGKGQRFYEKTCAKCHETGIGPELKGRGLPAAYYELIPRTGLRAMPAFRDSDIDDATLKDLAQYLASTPVKP